MIKRAKIWFLSKASMRTKLVISFGLLVTIPIIVLGIYSFNQSRANVEAQIADTMEINLARLVSELDTRIQKETDNTKFLAYNLNFRIGLENAKEDILGLAQALNETVEPVFWYILASDTYLKSIEVFSPLIEQNSVGPFLRADNTVRNTDWYQRHQQNFTTVWSMEEGRLYATRTILDTISSSQAVGVMRNEIFAATLFQPVDSMNYMGNGILLTDEKGQILYHKAAENDALDTLAGQMLRGEITEKDLAGKMHLHTEQMTTTGWYIYYYIDRAESVRELLPIIRSTLIVTGLCIAIAVVLVSILSKTFSVRILRLKTYAERVAKGEFDVRMPTADTDEIGIVTNSFLSMTNQLREMINRVYRIEIEKKTAELQALQAMINPHFLYNCLSKIKWMALYGGEEEIAESASLIARFYRTCLNKGQQLTTVKNELENIQAYVEMQRKMHENSFDVHYEINEGATGEQMLNFLLQPIVENAIAHGLDYMEGQSDRGLLIIRFHTDAEYLYFHIINNGKSIDLAYMQQVLHSRGSGYGVYNIRQRIELYYGADSGLTVSLTPEGHTCFIVKLARKGEPEERGADSEMSE